MEKFKKLLVSRKFWASVIGLVVLVIKQYSPSFPFSEQEILAFVAVIASYVVGVGLEDSAK
jgi:hypothetical protein